jgi:hypothetical protein
MGSEERNTEGGDGVRLFVGLVAVAIDFVSTAIGLWECRRRGCSKRDKALLRRRRNAYIRWVRGIIREAVRNE